MYGTPLYQSSSPYPDKLIISDMTTSIYAVESLLNYGFKNPSLLEDALTHPSCGEAESYQRLEFLGDAAIGLAISNYLYMEYPRIDPGQLTLLRSANISTEKLARVAVRHRLYMYVRHNAVKLDKKKLSLKNWKHLEVAWPTSKAESYQRLEFLGDATLGLDASNYVYMEYPELDPGQLSLLCSAKISTEKLARVAVRHRRYMFMRHNVVGLDKKVSDFASLVEKEDEIVVYGGAMKAPRVLADIVESVAAAVYVDCGYDLKALWLIIKGLLEPIITLDMLNQQPQPVTTLFEVCQKDGLEVDIKHKRIGEKNIASVYVDGQFVVSSSSGQKDNAKLHAAEAALAKLSQYVTNDDMSSEIYNGVNGTYEIEGAKQKLHEICDKKRWQKPTYKVDKEVGPAHERMYVCSVRIKTAHGILLEAGDMRSRVRDAESSAASLMIYALKEAKYF